MFKPSKKTVIITALIFLIIIGVLIAFIFNSSFSALNNTPFSSSKLNILIVGYDSSINGPPRADTIMIASINLNTKEIGVLSVPRDTRVNIPGHGIGKINASHVYGGIELVDKTLESFLDIPIDYYVETDFEGFSSIINAIGGITINIEEPLHYVDEAGGLYIDLPAGEVDLNGEKALEYVRYRGKTYGDIGRVKRQQKFVKAVMDRLLSFDIILKIPSIYKEVRQAVHTNIPLNDITPFLMLARGINFSKVETAMVPGTPEYIDGVSYWLADQNELKAVLNSLIRSKEYLKNDGYYISVYNGNGAPGIAGKLADELKKYGFKINEIANASRFNHNITKIYYYHKEDKSVVANIRKMIGGKLIYNKNKDKAKKDFKIVVGEDYLK